MGASPRTCRAVAMDLLARREHSALELGRKLRQRGFERGEIEATLDTLIRERLLSDERFAEAYVHHRAGRGFGPLRIERELAERGIGPELAALMLEAHDWTALAVQAREKRFGPATPESPRERARQIRFLNYRGFSAEQVRRALNNDDWD